MSLVSILINISYGFYLWLNLRLGNVIDKDVYDKIVIEMKASADFSERFYDNYQKSTGVDTAFTTKKYIFNKVINSILPSVKRKESPSALAAYGFVCETLDVWTVALALDKDVTPKKSLDNYLSRVCFNKNIKGFRNASLEYFGKEINCLTNKEMIELSIRSINPLYYQNHPEKLKEKILKISK